MSLRFKPQGVLGRLADRLMTPLMYLVQGNFREVPQRTHRWNNHKFSRFYQRRLIESFGRLLTFSGEPNATARWLGPIPLFHMPIFGGWKKFVVLKPVSETGDWHICWYPKDDVPGVSLVPIKGSVRVMIGASEVSFIGLKPDGRAVVLECIGEGYISQAGEFSDVLLL